MLILHEVLALSAAEVADLLDTSTQSVDSALQWARRTVAERVPGPGQQYERLDAEQHGMVDAFARRSSAPTPTLVHNG